ncbi:MAG: hypothetical protein LBR83_08110, partial [Clostridiales bacterium]|nr:hypothetical protein [Clostridiales bacterium]
MDTKSNHEIPRAGEPPAEEIRTRQNSRGVPVPERPERYEPAGYGGERPATAKAEKRGRKLNKPMGILLFLAALGLLTLMVYGFVIVMCAAGEGRVIGNLDGDYIRFYSSDAESRFSDSAAEALEVLYKALTDDLSINPAAY